MLRCTGNNVAFTSAAHNAQRMCERPLTFMTVKCPCNVGLHIVNNSRPNNQWSENFDPCRIAGAPPNCIFPCGGRGPHNTWFLGLTQVHSPNGISIGSSVLAQLVVMFNRHTHRHRRRPRYICRNRPYFAFRASMRPNKKSQ